MGKSAIARGASMAADVWGKLDDRLKAKGGTEDAMHILAKEEGAPLLDVIADILVKAELKTRNYPVTIDYGQSVEDMVKAGKYDYANEDIVAKNFPVEGNGTVEFELVLVHFDRDITSGAAIKKMEQMGLVPCKIEHLLALGAKHPELQRQQYSIICLGSSWVYPDGVRHVPCLYGYCGRRDLDLYWLGDNWGDHWRFLAVRKPR
ncbi:MAG: hypothetical protein WEA04_01165 [Candidatus Andersenbacteria bacterium]